ncbi:cryptochrome/photolyase family protein [Amnibacterium sp. CER49]|uniref:cryptochrome/photolyase family protein n=1 Tax=Amnibacterium sp. CER49 TaxID=3039161 RepID=UPI00244D7BAA|nr:cryptochrome/photolyase family protein [Amnibacterium sp. CER49]MDH2444744.1 cryptochrome/photolyase family protein [Amnibacterium sp. CER49]
MRQRLLFAEQLGPSFDDGEVPILLVESLAAFRRRPTHRAKAHLYLSALRHRAAELADRVEYVRAPRFREVLEGRDLEVIDPVSYRGRRLVRELGAEVLPSRGFVTSEADFREWVRGRSEKSLVMDTFYRWVREREGILMTPQGKPVGGRFSYDADNRRPPPKRRDTLGLPEAWTPEEDDIDAEVREDLDRWQADGLVRFAGEDRPRLFAATRAEALVALERFLDERLPAFGPYEDATLAADWRMSHSTLSMTMNLGLLDPREVVGRALGEHAAGRAPLASVEGFVRQIIGWRDWMWHLYWHLGESYTGRSNRLHATEPVPDLFWELDPEPVEANCLRSVLSDVRERGWAHHIQRLMMLGNFALIRGWSPQQMTEWFTGMFVDGTPWVMPTNVVGMSLHADGGIVATKPYAGGGAYINRMTDYCGGCRFDPRRRVGEDACPFTAGYWAFLDRVEPLIRDNPRMTRALAGMRRLPDLDEVVEQERARTTW